MLHYKSNEWSRATGGSKFLLGAKTMTRISVSCTDMMKIEAQKLSTSEWITIATGTNIHFRGILHGFTQVMVSHAGKTKSPYGIKSNLGAMQTGEKIDNSKAPVAPPPPNGSDLVLQLQETIRQEIRKNAPTVMEPESNIPTMGGYEIPEGSAEIFEEEEAQLASEQLVEPQPPAPNPQVPPVAPSEAPPEAVPSAPPEPAPTGE